jgi:hypothetical protein
MTHPGPAPVVAGPYLAVPQADDAFTRFALDCLRLSAAIARKEGAAPGATLDDALGHLRWIPGSFGRSPDDPDPGGHRPKPTRSLADGLAAVVKEHSGTDLSAALGRAVPAELDAWWRARTRQGSDSVTVEVVAIASGDHPNLTHLSITVRDPPSARHWSQAHRDGASVGPASVSTFGAPQDWAGVARDVALKLGGDDASARAGGAASEG